MEWNWVCLTTTHVLQDILAVLSWNNETMVHVLCFTIFFWHINYTITSLSRTRWYNFINTWHDMSTGNMAWRCQPNWHEQRWGVLKPIFFLFHHHFIHFHSIIEMSFNCLISQSSVWYKTKFGSQNFSYQLWCLFCNMCNVFKNMFNVIIFDKCQSM